MSAAGEYCPLCGETGRVVEHKDAVPLRLCACVPGGILLAWGYESESDYEAVYATPCAYHMAMQRDEGQPESFRRDADHLAASRARLQVIAPFLDVPDGELRLLDVGSGMGCFVQAAREAGYDAFGIDPSQDAQQWASEHQRPTDCGTWHSVKPSWNVITMHDVLEHLVHPLDCLRHLAECLTSGGALVVEMPEWNSPHQRSQGWEWRHIRPRQHVCLYSRQGAEALFTRAGLQVQAFWRPLRGSLGKATWILRSTDSPDGVAENG